MAQERCAKLRGEQRTAAEEAQQLKRKVLKGSWGAAEESAAEHASVERKARAYEQAFAQIKEATGVAEVDELVSTFIDAEEPSFALFSFVSELAGECEKLEMQISQMRSEIEQHRGQVLT